MVFCHIGRRKWIVGFLVQDGEEKGQDTVTVYRSPYTQFELFCIAMVLCISHLPGQHTGSTRCMEVFRDPISCVVYICTYQGFDLSAVL